MGEAMEVIVEDVEVEEEVTVDQFLNSNAPPPMKISVRHGTSKAAEQVGIQSYNRYISLASGGLIKFNIYFSPKTKLSKCARQAVQVFNNQ